MKLIRKGYKINFDKIHEGYLSAGVYTNAESRNRAKQQLLRDVKYDGWKLMYTNEELTYLNIPIKRDKAVDILLVNGVEIKRYEYDRQQIINKRNEELDSILNNPTVRYCYIVKGNAYYRPNCKGYTDRKIRAGVYDKSDAISQGKSCEDLRIIPIDVEEHNAMILDSINDLKSRIIKRELK